MVFLFCFLVLQELDSSSVIVELEKSWYACPQEPCGTDLLSAYSLGILLFESQLERAYFSNRSQLQLGEAVSKERNDLELLRNRERCSVDPVGLKK
ncbi:hypothetical protein L1987_25693 [Smallanthus sonchifolius]|uniref:Uncharacterized protein n=1 Tax=Smallanthus sonchifolius TaxID=185202 RepID=A0ACB9I8G5_9ASTR|nr:hypothetical protein L1987_25693 [Smallanthus sonchifolius]